MDGSRVQVRRARTGDAGAVAGLAGELAQSFPFSREQFDLAYPALVASQDACLLVAAEDGECLGYVLGFRHLTFYANGPVGWVEEILVRPECRGRGLGRALMSAFERWAAGHELHAGCARHPPGRPLLPGPGLPGLRGLLAQGPPVSGAVTGGPVCGRWRWLPSRAASVNPHGRPGHPQSLSPPGAAGS